MENPFLATLRLPVKHSPILVLVVAVVHGISFFLPWFTGLGFNIKVILSCMPLASICFYWVNDITKQRPVELILNSKDDWQVKMDTGMAHQASLANALFVHPLLTIISLHYDNHSQYFILTPEIIDADQFRRLRVRLRFHAESR